ncbi:peptide chain release factor N(5)-glutamine methyltransferase [Pseudaminobacter sp. NGMCC 1.201702]|uniref:peptide chain release factor N(5)-glutamine methyltransferase n=1 Tax=Pseudaminobacter sp. NGMCC 1.201702 TaxID=3391825 RepID=UPI0039F0E102
MAEAENTLGGVLRAARARLAAHGIDSAALDARLIVEHFSCTGRTEAVTSPGRVLDASILDAVDAAIARRAGGEPVHRILGFREFYGLELALSPATLEPRPDTETLVDMVLPLVRTTVERQGACRILDLGTGTGAIILALLSQVEQALGVGVDLSGEAVATARRNAERLGLAERFSALESDWFAKISGKFHLIVSNPPYIARKDIAALQAEVRNFDPPLALDGGEDGLGPYRVIAAGAACHLEADGYVAVEIGFDQKPSVIGIFDQAGYSLADSRSDLAGNDRALLFRR